ncbi:hypothetical protein D9M68_750250 [compost metagenome]
MGAEAVHLHVEVLHQQDEAEVGVLELVLVARVLAHAPGMPALTGEIHDGAGVVEEFDHARTDQPTVELADGIHATAEQSDVAQIDHSHGVCVEEDTPLRVFIEQRINSQQVLRLHLPISITCRYLPFRNCFV